MRGRFARTWSRLTGVAFTLLGAWLLVTNLADIRYSGWVLVWILASGALGVVGGVLFLLSLDGPARTRTPAIRIAGWTGMLVMALLPTSLSLPLLVILALTIPMARDASKPAGEADA